MVGSLGSQKIAVAGVVRLLFALSGDLAAWALAAVLTVLMAVLCAAETAAARRAGLERGAARVTAPPEREGS
jgi:hypothetical protein